MNLKLINKNVKSVETYKMNLTDENFQYYFDSHIKPQLEDIEKLRIKAKIYLSKQ